MPGSYNRTVSPNESPKRTSSTLPAPSKMFQQRVVALTSYQSSDPASAFRSRRCFELQVPTKKSKLFSASVMTGR